jgi:aspartyl-tRNA(Asn)/glutamyl-tRNA(Gln) amidotransferase subunit A
MCGCIGFKPTYGLISRHGLIPLNNYFDTVGIFANSIDLLVDVLNEIAGPDTKDATSMQREFYPFELTGDNFDIANLRIGLAKEFTPNGLSLSNSMALKHVSDLFSRIGESTIKEISLPHIPYSMSCYSILTSCEVASNFARYDGIRYGYHNNSQTKSARSSFNEILMKNRNESLGEIVKSRIVSGNFFLLKENYDKHFLKTQKIRRLIYNDFKQAFAKECDILIAPVNYYDTPTYAEYLARAEVFDDKEYFTACANVAGVPAISLPVLIKNDLPVGIQLIADVGQDELLLNVAKWFMQENRDNFEFLNLNI